MRKPRPIVTEATPEALDVAEGFVFISQGSRFDALVSLRDACNDLLRADRDAESKRVSAEIERLQKDVAAPGSIKL